MAAQPRVGDRRGIAGGAGCIQHEIPAVRSARRYVALAQEPAVFRADQQRGDGVFAGERFIHQFFVDKHVQHSQRQCQVGAGARRDPPGGVHGRRRVARIDDDDLGAGFPSVEQEAHGGHGRFRGIVSPHQEVAGIGPVCPFVGRLAEHALEAQHVVQAHVHGHVHPAEEIGAAAAADQCGQAAVVGQLRRARGARKGDALRAMGIDERGEATGDLVQRIVPAHRLEFAAAALTRAPHGRGNAFLGVDPLGQGQAAHAQALIADIRVIARSDAYQAAVAYCASQRRASAAVVGTDGVDDHFVSHEVRCRRLLERRTAGY